MGSKYATYLILLAAASVKILEQNGIIFTNIKKKGRVVTDSHMSYYKWRHKQRHIQNISPT